MPYQPGSNMVIAYKVQSALGTPATGASGRALRVTGGAGLSPRITLIRSALLRGDGMQTRGRHGSYSVPGGYETELCVGEPDELLRALFRASAETALATRTYDNSASLTSLQVTTTSEITQVGTTTLLGGVVERGDLIKMTNMSTAANNDVWAMVKSATATVITVYGTPFTVQAADIACTLTVAKKLKMGTTERYFTFDQWNRDLDISEAIYDIKVTGMRFSKRPNAPITVSLTLLGLTADALATGASPSLTSPTEYSTLPLVVAGGSVVAVGGTAYSDISGFDINVQLGGVAPEVLAANPPDVFLDPAAVDGSFQTLITDFDHFDAMLLETQQEIAIHVVEPEANPKDGMSFYLGNVILDSHDAPIAGSGPRVATVNWHAGKDDGGSDRAATTMKISSTAAAV